MAATETIVKGSTLSVNDGGAGAQAVLLEVIGVGDLPVIADNILIPVDYINQTNKEIPQIPSSRREPMDIQVRAHYIYAEETRWAALGAKTSGDSAPTFKHTRPDTHTLTFDAWVKNVKQEAFEIDGNKVLTTVATLTTNGPVTRG